MVIVKGNFKPAQKRPTKAPAEGTDGMMADLGLENMVILHQDDRGAIICCFGEYEGRPNFQVKVVYQKYGEWRHGKGLTINPALAKEVCQHLGELAASGKLDV